MNQASNIFLVGPMGAGKTSVGKQLAKALQRNFFDSDKEIEDRTGVNIPTIFDIEGEKGFRVRESQVIDDLTQQDRIVLATGGGAVLAVQNQKVLQSRGIVFYLYASIDQLYQRTHRDRNRPLLQTDNPKQKITELLEIRDPIYRAVADFVIETDGQTVRKVVEEIQRCLEAN